ncbi:MAG: SpoIIE family protein phosphatase [Kiritimatiellia bacterium]|nr:SpoIIE family protein phosphatase [Kiritimatiellia bacterium]MDP6809730.1 SpoIIE family protein phosphatase [Kiritimatiellia bacterium]MDP7025160.1 SpoIIE family protein phosphatase [Kiritimatiellia bacterium]
MYTGIYHLLLSYHRRRKRTDITFALTCFAMGLYDIFCAGLYTSVAAEDGMMWQRAQMLSLALVGIAFVWFCSDYTGAVSRRFRLASTGFFVVMALTMAAAPDSIIFRVDRPVLRAFRFLGRSVSYREVEFSLVGTSFHLLCILAFIYMLIVGLRFYQRESPQRAVPLMAALVCFFFGVVHDSAVAAGMIQSIYLLEYSYMGMVFLMAARLSTEVAEVSQTRALLNEMETRFRAFFQNTAVGLALTDCDGIVKRANPGLSQMFGESATSLVGQSVLDHFHSDDRATLTRMMDRIINGQGNTFRSERRFQWPDGSVFWGDISISTVSSADSTEELEGLIWIIVGITERRRAVDSLRGLNEELETRVQNRTRTLIETNRRLEDSLQKLRDDEEAGKSIQTSLLPPPIEQIGPLVFSRYLEPSFYVSGDFVDYFRIDEKHVGFYIADVSGHGVSSAFITVLLKSFMSYARERFMNGEEQVVLDPAMLLTRLNTELLGQDVGKHLTLFYGVIESDTNRLTFASGGQFPYPIMLSGGTADRMKVKGTPLGMFPFSTYENTELDLPTSFVCAFFSDGVLDLLDQDGLMDRQQHLESVVEQSDGDIGRMVKRLNLAGQTMPPNDISVLTVQRV